MYVTKTAQEILQKKGKFFYPKRGGGVGVAGKQMTLASTASSEFLAMCIHIYEYVIFPYKSHKCRVVVNSSRMF